MPGTCNGRAQISIYRNLWVKVGVATLNLALPTCTSSVICIGVCSSPTTPPPLHHCLFTMQLAKFFKWYNQDL